MKLPVLSDPIFVGRNHELDELMECLDSASSGKGKTLFIVGEAGSGKTRLINEFLYKIQDKNAIIITGWCLSNAIIPYFPFIEAFRHFSRNLKEIFSQDPFQTVGTKILLAENAQTFAPQVWMDQVFASVLKELVYLSAKKPTILVLEDIHWADSASLALLHYISRAIRTERVFVLATFRKEGLNSDINGQPLPLLETLRSMSREDLFEKVELPNLDVNQIGKLAESILGGDLDQNLTEKLYNESAGNPLFVVESLTMLLNEGSLIQKSGNWTLSVDKFSTPLKIKDIILLRLGVLRIKYRRILEVASVIGEKFDSSLIGAVLGQDALQILEKLDLISQSTSLVCCEDNYFRFDHAKTREIIYDVIPAPLKIGYHAKIAERLEKADKSFREFRASDLAYHYQKAGNREKALEYALSAGNDALFRFSNAEAIKHFTFVLENSSTFENSNKLMAIEGIGDALLAEGKFVQSGKMYDQLCDSDSGFVRLRAMRKSMHASFLRGNIVYSIELLRKAKEYSYFDRLEYARVRSSVGWAMGFRGHIKEAINYIEEALTIFHEEFSTSDMAEALYNLSELYVTEGRLYEAISAVQRSIILYREMDDFRGEMEAYFRSGHVFFNCGLYDQAWDSYSKSAEIGERVGDYNRLAWSTSYLSWVSESRNNLDEALSQIKRTAEYSEKTDSFYAQSIAYASFVRLYSKLGDLDSAEKYYGKLLKVRPVISSSASTLAYVVLIRSEAVLYAAKGDWQRAFESFKESLKLLKGSLFESLIEAEIRADYSWALKKKGFFSEAENQIGRIKDFKDRLKTRFDSAKVQAVLVASRRGRQEEIEVRLDLVNVSKYVARLMKALDLVPSSFVLSKLPSSYSFEEGVLNLEGKNIPAFGVISIKFTLRPTQNSIYNPNPIVVFSDELGNTQNVKPVFVNLTKEKINEELESIVKSDKKIEEPNYTPPQSIKLESNSQKAFNFLVFSFVEDYAKKRLTLEKAGWKTLAEISKYGAIPLHSMYGRNGRFGRSAVELERKGLIEKRFYSGERGRGGKILRIRVNYSTEYVNHEIQNVLNEKKTRSI
ncbi:MAG: BREX system ATP-binding domain-containing protein [Ignavibacteria bacterium]